MGGVASQLTLMEATSFLQFHQDAARRLRAQTRLDPAGLTIPRQPLANEPGGSVGSIEKHRP